MSEVKMVGWLHPGFPVPAGGVDPLFLSRFNELACRRVNKMRGWHPCYFCGNHENETKIYASCGKYNRLLGSAEIWVPAHKGDDIYAGPDLIVHYIEEHRCLPPQEFIEAVMHFDLQSTWDGEQVLEQLCHKYDSSTE